MFRIALAAAALVALQQMTLPSINSFAVAPAHLVAENAGTGENPSSRAPFAQSSAGWTDGAGALGIGPQ
jgi:hypothetical protein